MTASLARSDLQGLRDLADSWRQARRSAWFADGLHVALDAIEARRTSGPDFLDAAVYGNSVPELRDAALAEAQELYGPKADLAVVGVETVRTTRCEPGTRFRTDVTVRCLNYAEVSS